MTSPPIPPDHPHWVKFNVDGGTFMKGKNTRETRGIYWSVKCDDGVSEPTFIRKQDDHYKTNNDAEWCALKEALTYAAANHTTMPVVIYSDSMLVVKQFNGEWRSKIARHHRMRTECHELAKALKFLVVQWVPRQVSVDTLGH